jgi:hypothetical protein
MNYSCAVLWRDMLLHVLDAQKCVPPHELTATASPSGGSQDDCATSELLFADVVIERIGAKDSALRAANDPFLTIGVITRLAHGIIGYYVHYQILISVIN